MPVRSARRSSGARPIAVVRGRHCVLGFGRDGQIMVGNPRIRHLRRRGLKAHRRGGRSHLRQPRPALGDRPPASVGRVGLPLGRRYTGGEKRRSPLGDGSLRRSLRRDPTVLVFEEIPTGRTTRCWTSSICWPIGRAAIPLMIVCTSRPELFERRTGVGRWPAQRPHDLARRARSQEETSLLVERVARGGRRSLRSDPQRGGRPAPRVTRCMRWSLSGCCKIVGCSSVRSGWKPGGPCRRPAGIDPRNPRRPARRADARREGADPRRGGCRANRVDRGGVCTYPA